MSIILCSFIHSFIRDIESFSHGYNKLILLLHLKSVDLLEFGDLEGAVCVHALGLQVVQLRVPLLDLRLHVELLREHGAGLLVQLQTEGGQVVCNIMLDKDNRK